MPWGIGQSEHEEVWCGAYDTRAEAIAEGRMMYGDDEFWIQEGAHPEPSAFLPSAEWILERAAESAGDECGESAADWPDVGKDGQAALDALLSEWAERWAPIRFWTAVGNPERIEGTET